MPPLAIRAGRALTPGEEIRDAVVVVEEGKIAAIGRREQLTLPKRVREHDARNLTLVPGFIDIHIHGAGGRDVMEGEADALATVASTVARHGTTSLLATTLTASTEQTCRSLEGIARYLRRQPQRQEDSSAAEFLGIHLEGPFINPVRRGAHPSDWIAPPAAETFRRFLEAAGGCAKILTLAPEVPGALELVEQACQSGLVVGMGHTDATYEQARAAIRRGARHAVHVFNAMRAFSHRETGVLGAVLTSPEVSAELIADGIHVDAAAMRILLAAKGFQRVVLVSDATAAAGMPDGQYRLGPLEVTVTGGICRNAAGRLAGSTLTLDRALRNIVGLGVPLVHALAMLTVNPARLLGLERAKGVLAPGADADLLLLDPDLRVVGAMSRGVGLT